MNLGKSMLVTGLTMILTGLAGCSATAYRITQAPGSKTESAQSVDSLQCSEESRINAGVQLLFCGIGAPICRHVDDSGYEQCMRARGYQISPMN